ncbi:hypothetical protein [Streptomyces sp. NPDC058572]|uniref:hypothetical protein n=1 Tax=Streptomyces sp. NPDC058572 TaxID=3346546 RepID=UPI00364CB037
MNLPLTAAGGGGPNDATMEILSKQERTEALGQLEQLPGTGASAPRTHSGADVCYAARPNERHHLEVHCRALRSVQRRRAARA